MSTRCDFYQGRGQEAKYLGSIGRDAYLDELAPYFLGVSTLEAFKLSLAQTFGKHGEIPAEKGWPWPWASSDTTDNVIAFDEGIVWARHTSGFWAPLQGLDEPTPIPCVFPDMAAAYQKTARGRMAWRLRHEADIAVGPEQDVLVHVIVNLASLLSHQLLHVFEKDESIWVPACYWNSYSNRLAEITSIAGVLQSQGDDLAELQTQPTGAGGAICEGLINWARQISRHFEVESVSLAVDGKQPFCLGQALPEPDYRSFTGPVQFFRFREQHAMKAGLALLEDVYSLVPRLYAMAVATFLCNQGLERVERARLPDWIEQPKAELAGKSFTELASSHTGRDVLKRYAFSTVFEPSATT